MKRALFLLALAPLLATCATAPASSGASPRPWNSVPPDQLRITADRTTDDMKGQQVVIYGNGVAVWNNKVQFRVDDATIRKILAAFDAAAFDKLSSSEEGKVLRRRASIRAGGYQHEVYESWEEEDERLERREIEKRRAERRGGPAQIEPDPPLMILVDSIFAIVTPIAEKGGTTADSLDDGLKKIASGALPPETLSLTMLDKPELGRGEDKGGFLMRIDDATINSSAYQGQQKGFAAPRKIRPGVARMQEIASRLASFDPGTMPINLYSPRYVEVTVSVLDKKKNILARPFTGLDPAKKGEAQTRFDAMVAWLQSVEMDTSKTSQ